MTSEIYEGKRNELAAILNSVASLIRDIESDYNYLGFDALSKTRSEIEAYSKKVFENAFKVVLVAPFQGGKSTTFNAMSGGLCLSPMGDTAISCSATPIEIHHVQDASQVGAEIAMRSDEELAEICEAAGIPCELSDSNDVQKAFSAWQERFAADQSGQALLPVEKRNILNIAGFILAFCGNPKIRDYRSRGQLIVPLQEAARFAKFPEGFIIRLEQGNFDGFEVEEALFAFTRKIILRVQSPDLAKTGMVLVDCPGLFANAFDTKVTLAEMESANAIWFLLGDQMISASQLETIRTFPEALRARTFFADNIRQLKQNFINNVLPVSQITLRRTLGDNTRELYYYNALLALLARQGEDWLRDGRFADESVDRQLKFFSERQGLGVDNPADIWRTLARNCIFWLYPGGLPDFTPVLGDPLCRKGVDILKRESNWDEVVGAIQRHVFSVRARAILVEDSSDKALGLLNSLCELLKKRQENATCHYKELEERYLAASELLEEFANYASDKIESTIAGANGALIDRHLSEDVFRTVYLDAAEEIAKEAAPAIVHECTLVNVVLDTAILAGKKFARWVRRKLGDATAVQEVRTPAAFRCENAIKDAIGSVCGRKMGERLISFANGSDAEFRKFVLDPARRILVDLQRQWRQKCEENDLLRGLSAPDAEILNGKLTARDIIAKMKFTSAFDLLVRYGLAPALNEVTLVEAVQAKLTVDLASVLGKEEIKAKTCESIAEQVSQLRSQVVEKILAPIAAAREHFEGDKRMAMSDAQKADSERQKIAGDCAAILRRLETGGRDGGDIRDDIRRFVEGVEPLLVTEEKV